MNERYPIPGTAIVLFDEHSRVLLSRRIALTPDGRVKAGHGTYGTPGGKLIYGKSIIESALIELREEADLGPDDLDDGLHVFNLVTSEVYPEVDAHYICHWLYGQVKRDTVVSHIEYDAQGRPKNEAWGWYDISNLPSPLTRSVEFAATWLVNPMLMPWHTSHDVKTTHSTGEESSGSLETAAHQG